MTDALLEPWTGPWRTAGPGGIDGWRDGWRACPAGGTEETTEGAGVQALPDPSPGRDALGPTRSSAAPGSPSIERTPARRRWSAEEWSALLSFAGWVAVGLCVAAAVAVGATRPAMAARDRAVMAAFLAAMAIGARLITLGLSRGRLTRRRVVLLDGAGIEDARAALGGNHFEIAGACGSSSAETLLLLGEAGVDDVVLPRPATDRELASISWALQDASVALHAVDSGVIPAPFAGSGAPLRAYRRYRRARMSAGASHAKRAFDLMGGCVAVLLASPLFLLCAVMVWAESGGPILFAQRRVGLRGSFLAYKFRTMRVGAHLEHEELIRRHGNMFKLHRDPRVTTLGRLLRRLSLDELPQLFSVVRGEMSLVGPRPPMPQEVDRYTPEQLRRLGVKPGVTGLWQVSGRSDLSMDECVALDALYIEEWSPWLELRILARTPTAVLGGRGAY